MCGFLRGAALHLGAAAVTLGGKLMGITGMLFFIPLCSVIYALFRSYVKNRLVSKAVPPEKWRDPPPPTLPAVSVLSAALHLFKNRAVQIGRRFCAQIQFFIDKNPCQCYAIFDKNNCHFDLDHCQERG